MEFVLCVHHESPTLLLDHAVSSDDVRERESTYVSAVTATVWRKKGGGREKKKGERGEKKELSETGGAEGSAGRIFSVINHASI